MMMVKTAAARRLWSAGLVAACFSSGCISTDGLELDSLAFCATAIPSRAPWNSIVRVSSSLRLAGNVRCSGVAIAPNLVLTNIACITMPAELDEGDLDVQDPALFTDQSSVYFADVNYAADCLAGDEWQPVEDGDFSERVTRLLDPSLLRVETIVNAFPEATSTVRRVLHSRTETRCWDSLAVLVLDQPLSIQPALLRVDEGTKIGSGVLLSGFGIDNSFWIRHEIPGVVESMTFEDDDETAPPRSMHLSAFVCEFEHGGGVFAEDTGALLGIITSARDYDCVDEAAGTIATRLAPFRRLIAESAALSGEPLRVEDGGVSSSPRWPACPGG